VFYYVDSKKDNILCCSTVAVRNVTFSTKEDLKKGLTQAFLKLGVKKKVLAIPPDFTPLPFARRNSHKTYMGVLQREVD